MDYSLMHKNVRVADVIIDDVTGHITKIIGLCSPEHLPVGVEIKDGIVNRASLDEWWKGRAIPASRSGIREVLETLNIPDSQMLLTKSLGLSLSDQYWIKPYDKNIKWEDVNFFDNDFSDDIGNMLFGTGKFNADFDFSSPDNTSDGNLKKRWKIVDGRRYLVKAGSSPFMQQPFNEAIASLICERLGIPHIKYSVVWSNGEPYSICEDFVTKNTELIPAWHVLKTQKKRNDVSYYRHYINCCKSLGISDIEFALNQMIVLDYIIANEDRHFNNFGLIRDAETLKWLGAAPIYDSGTSLAYDKLTRQIRTGIPVICKPFKKEHKAQIMIVTDFSWIDFSKLKNIEAEIDSLLSGPMTEAFIDKDRKNAIIGSVKERITEVKEISEYNTNQKLDSITDDIVENIETSY